MTRVIPLTTSNKKKKNSNSSMMFESMDMQDLGLGSLPDLLFAEQLDVVPQQDEVDASKQQPGEEAAKDNSGGGLLDGAQKALFQDLEDLNERWQQPQPKKKSAGMKASSTANILSQALKECDLASFIQDNKMYIDQLSPAGQSSEEEEEEAEEAEQNSKLIDEMEEFISQHEFANSTEIMDSSSSSKDLTAVESKQAEDILDALMAGNITIDDCQAEQSSPEPQTNEVVAAAIAQDDSGYLSNISNISEVVTADGQKVVIIIANDTNQKNLPVEVKMEDEQNEVEAQSNSYESDPDWNPEAASTSSSARPKRAANPTWKARKIQEAEVKSGRVEKKKRGPYKRTATQNIKDKRERKKAQNVEAARRYRDKKKAEAEGVLNEETELANRNKELRSKVAEMENEMKTLKKLMKELGLVK